MKNKPFVLNTHGSLLGYKKYLAAGLQQLPYQLYDTLTFKMSAKRADAVVVSSKFEYEDAVEFGINKNKLHIIPMGIDLVESPVVKRQQNKAALDILFVGRLSRVRRVELLLQAVKSLSIPYHVTIVGGEEKTSSLQESGYLFELKKLCADLGINDKVTFTGTKLPAELKPYYENADIFVYPSLYENFGQPLLEAAAEGLPIIATAVGLAREIIQDGETGFIVPADPNVIRDRITRLFDTPTRNAMSKNIRETVRHDYAWDNIIQRYIEIYKSL